MPAGPVSRLIVTFANNAPMSAAEAGLSGDLVERPAEFGLERLGGLGRDFLSKFSKFFGLRCHGFDLLAHACARQLDSSTNSDGDQ